MQKIGGLKRLGYLRYTTPKLVNHCLAEPDDIDINALADMELEDAVASLGTNQHQKS